MTDAQLREIFTRGIEEARAGEGADASAELSKMREEFFGA